MNKHVSANCLTCHLRMAVSWTLPWLSNSTYTQDVIILEMGPIAINLTHHGVHLKYFMMTGYLYNEAWMASFSLWYCFSYIILILHGPSKHCFIFHKYKFLNHFHLFVSFPYNELTACSHSFYFSGTTIYSLCMA